MEKSTHYTDKELAWMEEQERQWERDDCGYTPPSTRYRKGRTAGEEKDLRALITYLKEENTAAQTRMEDAENLLEAAQDDLKVIRKTLEELEGMLL